MINRREFLGVTAGAGAALGLGPQLLRALQQADGTLIQRPIPSSGEMLPVIGLSFSNHPTCADHAGLREVLKAFVDGGGRVFDAMHASSPDAEQFHATVANELGIQDRVFWSTRGTPAGPPQPSAVAAAAATAQIERSLARLNVPRLDLVMVGPTADPAYLANLKEQKRAGRVRYIGMQVISDWRFPELEAVMLNEPIDFIGVNYDVGSRGAEETILPLARERGIGVMAFFPLGNNGGASCGGMGRNLFARVGDRPLPDWAAEFDARTWAQFFLKYVISHPAVTVARVGTTRAQHMLDNLGGGIGRLPDDATRRRMAELIDALPPLAEGPQGPPAGAPAGPPAPGIALSAALLDRYVGEYQAASGPLMTFRRDIATLIVKPGDLPEAPLVAQSETRFSDPRGPRIEFQLDGQGRVTGLIIEQGGQRIPLQRR